MSEAGRAVGCKELRRQRRAASRELRDLQRKQGMEPRPKSTLSNSKVRWKSVEEERDARQKAMEEHCKVWRAVLPWLLPRLAKIPDPRNPRSVKHKLTVLLFYGLLMFVLQMSSRREANREMSRPQLWENLQCLFPELESLPHHDTLNRVFGRIDVEEIQEAMADLVEGLIRNKKFWRYMVGKEYLIAIDGTRKFARDIPWASESLERHVRVGDGTQTRPEYYVYVLEASLVFPNGIIVPLHTEFLEYADGDDKQDCELKAFRRMAAWLKRRLPRLPIMILLDGLYPNGPIMSRCHRYGWQFMIVLKDDVLPSVWEEACSLRRLQPGQELDQAWGDRKQHFWWVDGIQYEYDTRRRLTVHVVVCEESWQEVARDSTEVVTKRARHAWVSSKPLTKGNVHYRCNLAARHRWAIENQILVEKHHGYEYEHCFSYDWNAMKGFHYLMRLAHLLNTLVELSIQVVEYVRMLGAQGFVRFVRETLAGPWLDVERIQALLTRRSQLRFV